MSRRKRTWAPGLHYHITSRGNQRAQIFIYKEDFSVFFHNLHSVFEKLPFEIVSYCVMNNHFHLLLSSNETHISKIMASINKKYADYFNKRYDLCGHVFEKRFFAEPIIGRKSLLEVSRYIHLNPVEAGVVSEAENYQWSSYRYYKDVTAETPPFLNRNPILDCYSGESLQEKSSQYCNFVVQGWTAPAENL